MTGEIPSTPSGRLSRDEVSSLALSLDPSLSERPGMLEVVYIDYISFVVMYENGEITPMQGEDDIGAWLVEGAINNLQQAIRSVKKLADVAITHYRGGYDA